MDVATGHGVTDLKWVFGIRGERKCILTMARRPAVTALFIKRSCQKASFKNKLECKSHIKDGVSSLVSGDEVYLSLLACDVQLFFKNHL